MAASEIEQLRRREQQGLKNRHRQSLRSGKCNGHDEGLCGDGVDLEANYLTTAFVGVNENLNIFSNDGSEVLRANRLIQLCLSGCEIG